MLVLAGGFGTRLTSAVRDVPKPMAPINGVPLLQLQLEHWVNQGQRRFIFLLHHQAEKIEELLRQQIIFFGSSISIDWIIEDTPLGTGGSVCNAICKRKLTDKILISNADTWLDNGMRKLVDAKGSAMGLVKVSDCKRYGSTSLNSDGYVDSFVEKTEGPSAKLAGIINAGLYKLPTSLFSGMDRKKFSLETVILPRLVREGKLLGVMLECEFFDIGIPEDYFKFCVWHKTRQTGNDTQ